MATKRGFSGVISVIALWLGIGIGITASAQTEQIVDDKSLALRNFSGTKACDQLQSYLADSFTEQFLTRFRCLGFGPCPLFLGTPEGDVPLAGLDTGAPAPDRVSDTNTQENGVDEADIVKTDRRGNLYILTGRRLVVMDAFPPSGLGQRAQAVLDLASGDPNFYASDFFLDETAGRLVALGSSYSDQGSRSISVIVDIKNPTAPSIVENLSVDGYPLEARRVGSRVHRVSRFDVTPPPRIFDNFALQRLRDEFFQAQDRGRDKLAARLKEEVRSGISVIVNNAGIRGFLPKLRTGDITTTLACSAIARPEVRTGAGLAVLESFNSDGSEHTVSGAINDSYIVYASANNFYLAQSSGGWFQEGYPAREETVVYRFALSDKTAPRYQGLGRVRGSVIGSYAFSEHADALRIASTENRLSASGTSRSLNHLTILRATGSDMPVMGSVHGFAPGEFIRGVRFLGKRGFVVTFRQVDPLFAFDLSDSNQPRIVSELKIPGFSSYLSPLGENFLLTAGRAGDEERLNGRLAIQLFDTQDLSQVRQLAAIEPITGNDSYSYSSAEYDPHAFAYFPDSASAATPGTLSIPLQTNDDYGTGFSGFLIVRVDPDAPEPLLELARVDHSAFAQPGGCNGDVIALPVDAGPAGDGFSGSPCIDSGFAAEPRRSTFAQDGAGTYLYTLSSVGVLASDALDPKRELGRAALPFDPPTCCSIQPFIDQVRAPAANTGN